MATKEDILEQIVEEYLSHKGYFVRHNIKFLPRRDHPEFVSNQHSNHSDIDVIGYHPKLEGDKRVVVVSCKSWQGGFNPATEIQAISDKRILRGREAWKGFRELASPIWSEAFRDVVVRETGTDRFTYVTAVARLDGEKAVWENYEPFRAAIGGNPIAVITFQDMIEEIQKELTQTLASTEVGRMLQMFKAANMNIGEMR